jgi:eukaryotic-like serine/threonine-protein kinase
MTHNAEQATVRAPLMVSKPCDEPKLLSRGRYQISMELAKGEESTIYLALHRAGGGESSPGIERVVVMKRVHAHLSAKPNFASTVLAEAQSLSRVRHPALCRVYDVGRDDEGFFVVMEYLEGESVAAIQSVRDRTARERLPLIAARVFAGLCGGLYASHEARQELEHEPSAQRVLTPRNLFVLYDGGVRILDFAVAPPQGMLHRTSKGSIDAQLAYMAPEHFAQGEVDQRADIWSLGVALWEMLTGQQLFESGSMKDTMQAVMKKPITAPSALNSHVPPALDAIVLRALERDPALRQQSARELGDALEGVVAGFSEPIGAGQIALWLDTLYPGQAAAKRGLRGAARTLAERVAVLSERAAAQQASLMPKVIDLAKPANDVALPRLPAIEDEPVLIPRRPVWMLAGAGLLLVVLTLGLWLASITQAR